MADRFDTLVFNKVFEWLLWGRRSYRLEVIVTRWRGDVADDWQDDVAERHIIADLQRVTRPVDRRRAPQHAILAASRAAGGRPFRGLTRTWE